MTMIRRIFSFLVLTVTAAACSPDSRFDLLVLDVSVVDVIDGTTANHMNIGIRDAEIVYLGPEAAQAERVVSATGLWAIPGLWDMHVHVSDASFFPLFLNNGVVGVRDMGGAAASPSDGCTSIEIDTLKAWRDDIRSGEIAGPEIVMAGPVLSGTGAPGSLRVTTPEEARRAVATIDKAGSDFIKVYEDIPREAFAALATAASKARLPFAGHVSEETLTVLEALDMGQRSVEHVRSHLLLCFAETAAERDAFYRADDWDADDRAWAVPHVEACADVWDAFRDRDAWLTPTLAVQETLETGATPEFLKDPRRSSLPASILQAVETRGRALAGRTAAEVREAATWNDYIHRLVRRADAEGVHMLAGSDAACEGVMPGYGLHRELELLVEAGLSPLKALQAATSEPARYFGRQAGSGRLERGFEADIVLLRRNPLDDISAVRDIDAVIVGGDIAYVAGDKR